MWLGERRGELIDWCSQQWVRLTGRRVDLSAAPWLDGPAGSTRRIGPGFLNEWAAARGLEVERFTTGAGLLPSFAALAGPGFDPAAVDPAVAAFYERTAGYEIDVWSEWSGLFQPFGFLVAALFSRRLEQLNLPLSPLDASRGMTSEIVRLTDPRSGETRVNAWVRTLIRTGRITYVGGYAVATPPGAGGPCVKTVFPLPNGAAVVLLRPTAPGDGSLELISDGRRFGDPGFYFTVSRPDGTAVARHLRVFRERIRVYPAGAGETGSGETGAGEVRADHVMTLWGLRCLHLHYRMRPKRGEA